MNSDDSNQTVPPTGASISLNEHDQFNILELARKKLRDLECLHKNDADTWRKKGANEQAQFCKDKAEAVGEAVHVLLDVQVDYLKSKNATY